MEDWGAVRARLAEAVEGVTSDEYFVEVQPADIRAALERDEQREREVGSLLDRLEAGTLHRLVCNADQSKPIGGDLCICNPLRPEVLRLRQRVEELEHDSAEWSTIANHKGALLEAAEAKLAVWERAESLPDCPACAALAAAKEDK